jgi:class 3 adenylate cyclase
MKACLLFCSMLVFSPVMAQDSLNRRPAPEADFRTDSEKSNVKDKLLNLGISKKFNRTKNSVAITLALQQAKLAESQARYLTAINYYQKAIDLYVQQGDQQAVTDNIQQIAMLYQKLGRTQQALDKYQEVLERKEIMGDTTNLSVIRNNLIQLKPVSARAIEPPKETIPSNTGPVVDQKDHEQQRLKTLAESTESSQDYKKSLEYYKLYTELENRQKDEQQAQQLALQEKTFQLEKQGQRMSLLEAEKAVQALTLGQQEEQLAGELAFKRNLWAGLIILFVAAIISFVLYRGKRKALGALSMAYNELNTTKDKLEDAEGMLKNLLDQQVSHGVARQLMDSSTADEAQKKFVCVMFLDIRGFTPFAERLLPEEIIKYQNDVFGLMIDLIDSNHGVINQFLGDGFMATFGLQDIQSNVCDDALAAATQIIEVVNSKSKSGVIPPTRVGIGLDAGNVVAGNVGTAIRKQYSITGNTVITASRIEKVNKKFKSQLLISKQVFDQLSQPEKLPDDFVMEELTGQKQPVVLLRVA